MRKFIIAIYVFFGEVHDIFNIPKPSKSIRIISVSENTFP